MASSHLHHDDARRTRGDKLSKMTGSRGEYPPDRAARLAGPATGGGQGDSTKIMDADCSAPAAARQIDMTGKITTGG
jgi:hypothetical protein